MTGPDRKRPRLTLATRLASVHPARLLPACLLLFVAAAFVLPTEPAYALVFYLLVLPCALARAVQGGIALQDRGYALATVLIYWSAVTLLWGRDDGHRWLRFAVGSAMTAIFLDTLMWVLRDRPNRTRLMTLLVWVGTANAMLAVVLGQTTPQDGPRMHGWGITSHPILGASVMVVAYLAALCRAVAGGRWRYAYGAAAVTMVVFILLTESRGPLLAGFVATLFVCAAGPWRWRALAMLALPTAAWQLLPASVRQHQAAILMARGSSHRFEIWHRTLQMVWTHPFVGNGLAANLDLPGMTFPHDLYLSVLFYSGTVGLALFAALAWVVTDRLRRSIGKGDADWLWMMALWLNALLSGLTDLGQITKGPGPIWLIFWLPAGLVLSASPPRIGSRSRSHGAVGGLQPAWRQPTGFSDS